LFWQKFFEDGNCPSPGLNAQYLEFPELSLISYAKPIEKYLPERAFWQSHVLLLFGFLFAHRKSLNCGVFTNKVQKANIS
jgi:hypothetical protein